MSEDATANLQILIDRMAQGDCKARRELLERAHARLTKLAAWILANSFPALRASHDVDSVVNESWLRLVQALEKTQVPTAADFLRLAAHKIRQVLLDMADRDRRRGRRAVGVVGGSSADLPPEPADQTYDPSRLALWTELHRKVAALPEPERDVFAMHYYLGLPQAEIARALGLPPRKVSYLWVAATDRLAADLAGLEGLL